MIVDRMCLQQRLGVGRGGAQVTTKEVQPWSVWSDSPRKKIFFYTPHSQRQTVKQEKFKGG